MRGRWSSSARSDNRPIFTARYTALRPRLSPSGCRPPTRQARNLGHLDVQRDEQNRVFFRLHAGSRILGARTSDLTVAIVAVALLFGVPGFIGLWLPALGRGPTAEP